MSSVANPSIKDLLRDFVVPQEVRLVFGLAALFSACEEPEEEEEKKEEGKKLCLDPREAGNDSLSLFCLPIDEESSVYSNGKHRIVADPKISRFTADFYLAKIPEFEKRVEDFFEITSPWHGNIILALLQEEVLDERLIRWRGRAGPGYVWVGVPGRDMELFNDLANSGEYLHEGVFLHEFSHALRERISDFSPLLEEGLATYTQIHLRRDNTEPFTPRGWGGMTGVECDNGEYRIYKDFRNRSGDLEREYLSPPSDWRSLDILNVFARGFCFWDTIRENYGHLAVQAIVQSMVEFAKEHENVCDPYAYFPFFETFTAVTGMDESHARAYFDTFSVSTDDNDYPLGGVSWAD